VAELEVAAEDEFPPGTSKIVQHGTLHVGIYNCGGELYAIEDRCSHDDGPLCEGDWDEDLCRVVCPRHGAVFDLASGRPMSLPATEPVATFPLRVVDGTVLLELPDSAEAI
jgi:3-phenylpropionate/trans-cinnamate dioxygenase ferredoxin subunit